MFADYIKMAAKAVALVAGAAIILVIFNSITIPNLDISVASDYLNIAYSIGNHYLLGFPILWNLGMALLALELAELTTRLALIAIKWVLKVNE